MAAPLDATKLHITHNAHPVEKPNPENLKFGNVFTDHMLQIEWTAAYGWHEPQIVPYGKLSIDPSAGVLNYAVECFEGMKAYKDDQGRPRLFRPEVNIARLNRSAARVALPSFDPAAFLALLTRFVALESGHIPASRGHALYLRPVLIGTNQGLSVSPPTSALLYVIASPVGSYYQTGAKALTLEAVPSSEWVRAWPGGSGSHKLGANYGPCMMAEVEIKKRGADQVLWLFGDDDLLTEAGTMNLFVLLRRPDLGGVRELVTPLLDGTILPGVNRTCVLELARERLEGQDFIVRERDITIQELEAAGEAGNLEEIFGSGTAAIVTPVRSVRWAGRTITCALPAEVVLGEVAGKMKDWIEARQYGDDEHEWSVLVDQST